MNNEINSFKHQSIIWVKIKASGSYRIFLI